MSIYIKAVIFLKQNSVIRLALKFVSAIPLFAFLGGCFNVPLKSGYEGPATRPPELNQYYDKGRSFTGYQVTPLEEARDYTHSRITVQSDAGEATIDYYARRIPNPNLVFVFPVLGGRKNLIENYFATYFVRHGIDAAIVHRDESIKDPGNLDNIEEILRKGLIRDRISIDFFESQFGKKNFGTFGISRGAINAALAAGIDERLKYNVIALGASNLVEVIRSSDERRIQKYKKTLMEQRGMSEKEFIEFLSARLKSEPDRVAKYIDARNTLIILSLFDDTVPIRYGRLLREQIGKPETIYLIADHKTAVLYTQIVPLIPPNRCAGIFPFDYIETEATHFFNRSFQRKTAGLKHYFFSFLSLPFNLAERLFHIVE